MKRNHMHNYAVQYELGGETNWQRTGAADPGHAFAKTQLKFPKAKIPKALRSGRPQWLRQGWTEYDPPPVQREIKPQPRCFNPKKAAANTATFPFYDEVVSLSPKKQPKTTKQTGELS